MSETLIGALIGAGVAIFTQITTAVIDKYKNDSEVNQKELQTKRENLTVIYRKLISVVNSYPNKSPNDVLKNIEYAPNYSIEHFSGVFTSLDYQIEDYKNQLNYKNISIERKSDLNVQISNREYAKKKIIEIQNKYFNARENYKSFCESDKMIFDLYAGENVRNNLVQFEIVTHNVLTVGNSVGEAYDPLNNSIEISRRNLIDSMRNDLGIT